MSVFLDRIKHVFGWDVPTPQRTYKGSAHDDSIDDMSPSKLYTDSMSLYRENRKNRYDIYDSMDRMPDVASILDASSEDATQMDEEQEKTVWIEGDNKKAVDECTFMLATIDAETWIEACCRDTAKYGDDFARVVVSPDLGVRGLEWRDPRDIERIENRDGILLGYHPVKKLSDYKRKFKDDPKAMPQYAPWDFVHFRLYRHKRLPFEKTRHIYGTSLLWSSDRIAKQVKILDDMLMIVRLTRSLDRYVYRVDVGRSPVEEEIRILKRWRRALKRKTYIEPTSGRFDSRFDPLSFTEDIFFPVKEGSNSSIETMQGLGSVRDQVDIEHFRDKFFGSFRAPKAYFGYDGESNSKATLSNQSMRWGRSVNSLQRSVKNGLTRLCQIHLSYKGFPKEVIVNPNTFRVMMVRPSVLELLERLEAWQTMIDVAERMAALHEVLDLDRYEWNGYVLENVLWLNDGDIKRVRKPKEEISQDEPSDSDDKDSPEFDDKPPTREQIKEAIVRVANSMKSTGAHPFELPNGN